MPSAPSALHVGKPPAREVAGTTYQRCPLQPEGLQMLKKALLAIAVAAMVAGADDCVVQGKGRGKRGGGRSASRGSAQSHDEWPRDIRP